MQEIPENERGAQQVVEELRKYDQAIEEKLAHGTSIIDNVDCHLRNSIRLDLDKISTEILGHSQISTSN